MTGRDRWPSGWWFWGFPLAANLYLVPVILVLRLPYYRVMPTLMEVIVDWVELPAGSFQVNIVYPASKALHMGYGAVSRALLFMTLWELAAAALGLVVHGAAFLVYAIVPEPGARGEGRSDG